MLQMLQKQAEMRTDSSFYLDSNASNSNEALTSVCSSNTQTAVCARQAHGGA